MDNIILQQHFDPLLPMNGSQCNTILKHIYPGYKEILSYSNECVYVGHCEIRDPVTGYLSKAPTKIGKSRYLSAINRGRSQGGCDWIFDYILFTPSGKSYTELETIIHHRLKEYNINKPCHKELYNLSTQSAISKVKIIAREEGFYTTDTEPKIINYYMNNPL